MCIKVSSLFVLIFVAISFLIALPLKTNAGKIAIYWGQGNKQSEGTLTETCNTGHYNYVIIAFVSKFGNGQTPSINLAGHCDPSNLGCAKVGNGIKNCQNMGVKVLLSIGGGVNGDPTRAKPYSLGSAQEARDFADYLWDNFLEGRSQTRPFGDAVVDGIDFDIEIESPHYIALARRLSEHKQQSSKKIHLSAAPQCPLQPDTHLNAALRTGLFDYVWIQFYNNPECEFDVSDPNKFKNAWNQWTSIPAKKFFVGLPSAKDAATNGFIPSKTLINQVIPFVKSIGDKYGGVMLWDRKHDHGYSSSIKDYV